MDAAYRGRALKSQKNRFAALRRAATRWPMDDGNGEIVDFGWLPKARTART